MRRAAEAHADFALSGAHLPSRPRANQLLPDAKDRRFDIIVAEALDRRPRAQEEAGTILPIFTDYVAGASPRTIAAAANRRQIPSRAGTTWNVSALLVTENHAVRKRLRESSLQRRDLIHAGIVKLNKRIGSIVGVIADGLTTQAMKGHLGTLEREPGMMTGEQAMQPCGTGCEI